jgi:hypothetical protein
MNNHRSLPRRLAGGIVAALAGSLVATGLATPPSSAAPPASAGAPAGTRSLVQVLGADGNRLDRRWHDYDILEKAVRAVLADDPSSPVGVLADGSTRLTAFLPTDRAFRRLVFSLTGHRPPTEQRTLARLVRLVDIDTIETVLLYHVVPGRTLASPAVARAAGQGARLVTAQGKRVQVDRAPSGIRLLDQDRNARNAFVVRVDINKGNRQIAHGISRVLRPVDL